MATLYRVTHDTNRPAKMAEGVTRLVAGKWCVAQIAGDDRYAWERGLVSYYVVDGAALQVFVTDGENFSWEAPELTQDPPAIEAECVRRFGLDFEPMTDEDRLRFQGADETTLISFHDERCVSLWEPSTVTIHEVQFDENFDASEVTEWCGEPTGGPPEKTYLGCAHCAVSRMLMRRQSATGRSVVTRDTVFQLMEVVGDMAHSARESGHVDWSVMMKFARNALEAIEQKIAAAQWTQGGMVHVRVNDETWTTRRG